MIFALAWAAKRADALRHGRCNVIFVLLGEFMLKGKSYSFPCDFCKFRLVNIYRYTIVQLQLVNVDYSRNVR